MVDASVVARGTGIETKYQDTRGGKVLFLPQQIAVFAQGASDAVYSDEKWLAPNAAAAGQRYGVGCPIHLILRELMPANGDGVGTIPVMVYPLSDAGGAVAASGNITPSGTAYKAGEYRLRIGGVLSSAFVIPAGAVDVSAVASAISIAIRSVLEMPVKVSHTYGSATATPGGSNVGNGTVTAITTTGVPTPGQWKLTANAAVANGGVFTLTDPSGTVVSNSVTMTPGAGAATPLSVGGLGFTLTDGSNNFAVGDTFTINVPATDAVLTAKWKGKGGNAIKIEVIGESLGVAWTITQLSGGLVDPSVDSALDRVGPVWESMAINGSPIENTTVLDAFEAFGVGRWDARVRKPLVVFTGVTYATVEAATAICSGRRDDYINSQLVAPGSPNLPFVVAARQVARIAQQANNKPASDYGSLRATGLIAGSDRDQWDWTQRDQALKLGSSTVEIKDGVVALSDVVTFYRPADEEPPSKRFVKDIVRIQTALYNIDLRFSAPDWDGAPFIPDGQPTVNPDARTPSGAVADAAAIVQSLADNAIVVRADETKKAITATIAGPNRLDLVIPILLSGNTNIKDIQLRWGFNFN
jgi:phage tail sheath gpL-like